VIANARLPLRQEIATRVIAIATSAGGLAALSQVLHDLPIGFPAGVLVVQHLQPSHPSHLARILGWHTALTVTEARGGVAPRNGTVYVAPPAAHLLVGVDRRLLLSQLPPLHYCRPSGDRLFASVATTFGPDAIAVVLTGNGRDGAEGAQLVRRYGGIVIVQDEPSSAYVGMPRAAVQAGSVDRVLPLEEIGPALQALVASGQAA
jgi:two-component system, chemotaxis family, protein-glutamate methylesterase/glutaminase